jgi:hypothetical protein
MPRLRLGCPVALLIGSMALAACNSNPSPTAQSTTTSSTSSRASTTTAVDLVLHISPTTNLHGGESVRVSVAGFPPGKAYLSECASVADVNPLGCGAQLAAQPFVEVENGTGSTIFTVSNQAASNPLSAEPTARCTNQCVLVATSGAPSSGARHIQTGKLVFGS